MPSGVERKFWGWGRVGGGPSQAAVDDAVGRLVSLLGAVPEPVLPPRPDDLTLPPPRLSPPQSLAGIAGHAPADRAGHHYGKSYRDVVRGLRNHFPAPPDLVLRPRSEDEIAAVLEWCTAEHIAAVPYGGGSSVVGGVETAVPGDHRGVVSLDLERLDRVLEVDAASQSARIQAGAFGPALEAQLRPHNLTLRHYPQSFEFSTLGGWIATRSAGHYATLHTRIDDFVAATRTLTPSGPMETARFPSSGAGPSPDRLVLGSEGTLGVITEAWMRLRPSPRHRAARAVPFPDGYLAGAVAVRALAQSGLHPDNCRLLDPVEAMLASVDAGGAAVLLVGFESAHRPVDGALAAALEICRDHGGLVRPPEAGGGEPGAGWREAFLAAPYLRDELAARSVVVETFESAVPWSAFAEFHVAVAAATLDAVRRVCGTGIVAARITHAYPDGAAPYFTVVAPGRRGSEIRQWDEIKAAAGDAITGAGGTITHHHAVGRDHRRWADRQRPEAFTRVLRAAKRQLDPAGILNPGVLFPT